MPVIITNGILKATIAGRGAELTSLKKHGKEYMWEGNPYYWGKHSPVLFPIVGTLKNDEYQTNGKLYQMVRHGFARDSHFEIVDQREDSVTFVLKQDNRTLAIYPFDFELKISYKFVGEAMQIVYGVKNTGNQQMPYSLGTHPAFALDDAIGRYSLRFPEDDALTYHHLKDNLLCPETSVIPFKEKNLALSPDMFANDALVIKSLRSRSVALCKNGVEIIRVEFPDFPNLGLWTKPGAPFLCIEPWHGYADSFEKENAVIEQKEGIRLLDVSDSHAYALKIIPGF